MRLKASALITLIAVLTTACGARVGSQAVSGRVSSKPAVVSPSPNLASAPPTPSWTPPTSPAPSGLPAPIPTVPRDLARVAVKQRGGIRVEIELQRNPLPAGEPSWIKVTVTNRGANDVTWFHDGCALAAVVQGRSEVAWPMGQEHTAQPAMFKTYALGGSIADSPSPHGWFLFVPKAHLNAGSYGCADIGIPDRIRPGRSNRQTLWWSGFTDLNRSMPPTGSATILASAAYYWRGSKEPERITDQAIDLELAAWITSEDATERLSPAQIVDAAVADSAFAAYLDTQSIANGREAIAWYDAARDVWEVGLLVWYEATTPRISGVVVDPVTGAILAPLDRAWDQEQDGFP